MIAAREEAHRRHRDVSDLVMDSFSVCGDEAERLDRKYPGYFETWRFPYLK